VVEIKPKMDQEKHWDHVGKRYDTEIFDVFSSDVKGVLPYFFKKNADKNKSAIDFGCGTGKAFPYLSEAFKSVVGVDISSTCLQQAASRGFKNVSIQKADLTLDVQLPLVDFIFCCNVIMLSSPELNRQMIQNIHRALKKNGVTVVIIPSLESVLYSSQRLIEWYKKEGVSPNQIPSSELAYYHKGKVDTINGIINIDGVDTKHYLEPELRMLFGGAGFEITAIEKVEYSWETEFDSPPEWIQEPFPWDWLVECNKK
jgi:SAM-dependent methyltransferase